jgi:fumarylacetoacetate (FAA) hydrolase
VTPDELGEAWKGGKLHLPLHVDLNGQPFGRAEAGVDMTFDFGQLIAHAAKTRTLLSAGTIIGSGTVSNKMDGGPGKPLSRRAGGILLHRRAARDRDIENGEATTPFLKFGDTIRIEMLDGEGHSIFGAIEQTVQQARDGAPININKRHTRARHGYPCRERTAQYRPGVRHGYGAWIAGSSPAMTRTS